ncbi:MAG: radical SAM protein [Deltaproteobacteria bacterium]|nr:radical SAM protein [Candidatus Anaeroferrophillus wilburensis]MBN2888699.1 radical SAM protein [Deltaproteobacteria bacterium]
MNYLFGPVPSRRLGLSLGVDLVPFKTCSFDCLYCELGRTTSHTSKRQMYAPVAAVDAELTAYFQQPGGVSCDVVTLSGSGEPTLHEGLAAIVRRIRELTTIPVALLTNSSLLADPGVRQAAALVDIILPSLDAVSPEVFARLNRPVPEVTVDAIIAGLLALRQEFAGALWLEVLFCRGINDHETEIARLSEVIHHLQPDKIHLNTVVRPGAYREAQPVSAAFLHQVQRRWGPRAEIVAPFERERLNEQQQDCQRLIVDTVKRRPCTVRDLAVLCALAPAEVVKIIDLLQGVGAIRATDHEGQIFYCAD